MRSKGRMGDSFNPLPAFWPGETKIELPKTGVTRVSIRSRLFGREKLRRQRILPTPKGPFQSAPGFLAGRNRTTGATPSFGHLFQSAPGFLAGRNFFGSWPELLIGVSIRSRLFGREKRAFELPSKANNHLFQSAPGFLAGRNVREVVLMFPIQFGFNPLPAFWPGETRCSRAASSTTSSFNPLPAFWPGETTCCTLTSATCTFQSAPGFLAGRNTVEGLDSCKLDAVSIRSRLFGREKRRPGAMRARAGSFNPLPAFWPGETKYHVMCKNV